MKLKHFESALEDVKTFEEPDYELEQYQTSAHLAAQVILCIQNEFEDIEDKVVCDLGCGTGILGIASCLLGASQVIGVDMDPSALSIASDNIDNYEVNMHLVQSQVTLGQKLPIRDGIIDTVVMNPPFGTRKKGADLDFVQVALQTGASAVYSMHKTSTRPHIIKKAAGWGAEATAIAQLAFDIPQTYKFHRQKSADVEVDLIRFVPASHK